MATHCYGRTARAHRDAPRSGARADARRRSLTASSGPINAKHFFWAPGQPGATVADSTANDIVYHGGNAGPGAIGVETKPAVYLDLLGPRVGLRLPDRRHRREALLEQDAPDLHELVLPERRRQPLGRRADAVLQRHAARLDELRRRHRLRHEPEEAAEGQSGPTRRRCPTDIVTLGLAENLVDDPLAAEAQRAVGALRLRPAGDLHHPDAAEHDRHRAARLLRLPLADDEHRRAREPVPHPVRVHPVPEHELARRRHDRLRDAQRQRDEQRLRQRHLRRLQHRHRPRVLRGGHRPRQLLLRARTAGTTPRAARTPTSAPGRTRRTSRSAATQFAVQPTWSNEAYDATGNGCAVSR